MGNCCSDFDSIGCQNIFNNSGLVDPLECAKNTGCTFCDSSSKVLVNGQSVPSCNLCRENLFNLEGRCVDTCPLSFSENDSNKLCQEKLSCNISNCDSCDESGVKCKTCRRGTFKYDDMCLDECPENYRADRITWACLEPPVFAWYWVSPSSNSCKTNCGVVVSEDWDCSCSEDCFRFGNCCQDIEDFCPDLIFWRKKGNRKAAKALPKKRTQQSNKVTSKKVVALKTENKKEEKPSKSTFLKKKD